MAAGGWQISGHLEHYDLFLLQYTLDSLINVLHAYLFLRPFSLHHDLISLDNLFTLGLIHSRMFFIVWKEQANSKNVLKTELVDGKCAFGLSRLLNF